MRRQTTSRWNEKDYMIDLALYNIRSEVTTISAKKRNELFFGYECKEDLDERLQILCRMLTHLEDEQIITALGGECLTIEEAECYISKHVVLFEEGARADLEKDTSGLQLWIALNPDSVPRQKWEEAACNVACEYELVITANPTACEYELSSSSDTMECEFVDEFVAAHKECSIEMATLSFEELCALEFDTLLTDKACEIGFDVYMKENGCTLDLEHYICLRECNLDQTIIRTVLAAGCTVTVGQ